MNIRIIKILLQNLHVFIFNTAPLARLLPAVMVVAQSDKKS